MEKIDSISNFLGDLYGIGDFEGYFVSASTRKRIYSKES
jgi:hypothetical protein